MVAREGESRGWRRGWERRKASGVGGVLVERKVSKISRVDAKPESKIPDCALRVRSVPQP